MGRRWWGGGDTEGLRGRVDGALFQFMLLACLELSRLSADLTLEIVNSEEIFERYIYIYIHIYI